MTPCSSLPGATPWLPRRRADHITLAPASLLPFKEQWHRRGAAGSLRDALFIVPEYGTPLRRTMLQLMPYLRAGGRQVITLSVEQFD